MMTYVYALLLAGYPLAYLLHRWRLRSVFMHGTRILSEQVADLQIGVERAREQVGQERDKTSRYVKQILAIERERDDWHNLYTGQAIGHGNAQNLMMGEIEKLARTLAAKGVKYSMPRILQDVREEYLGKYEMPARADKPLPEIAPDARGGGASGRPARCEFSRGGDCRPLDKLTI